MNDWDLVLEYRTSHSEAAFEELVRRHAGMVYGTALRHLRDTQLAEDATQTVFVLLARRAEALQAGVVPGGWLYQAARFVSLKFGRDLEHRRRKEIEASTMAISESEKVWTDVSGCLDEALAELGEVDRNALILRFMEQRSFREVAEALKLKEDAAKKRVARALVKLRDSLGRLGVTVSVAALASLLSSQLLAAAPDKVIAGSLQAVRLGREPAVELPFEIGEQTGSLIFATLKWAACLTIGLAVLWLGVRSKAPVPKVEEQSSVVTQVQNTTVAETLQRAPPEAEKPSLTVRVLEAETGNPIVGADVAVFYYYAAQKWAEHTDANGEVKFQRPLQPFQGMDLFAGAPGRVGRSAHWREQEAMTLPASYTIRLAEGHKIIGRVIDEQTNGVAGATVHFWGEANDFTSREAVAYLAELAPVTDKAGFWEATMFPANTTWLHGHLAHPEYLETKFGQNVQPDDAETLVLTIQKGVELAGNVTDEGDNPINGAVVHTKGSGDELTGVIDDEGKFSFRRVATGGAKIDVTASGYIRAAREIVIEKSGTMLNLKLKVEPRMGNGMLRARLVDSEGRGINYAQVRVNPADEKTRYAPSVKRDGRFEWGHAPEGNVEVWAGLDFSNDVVTTNLPTDGVEREIRFPAKEIMTLEGTIRDAGTKELLRKVQLSLNALPEWRGVTQPEFLGEAYEGRFKFAIEQDKVRRRDRVDFPETDAGRKGCAILMVHADGYAKRSIDLPIQTNAMVLNIELEASDDVSGTVLLPNGLPAVGAEVGFRVAPGGAWMETPGHFAKPHHPSQASTVTGRDGTFRLEQVFDAKRVVVVHEMGWACVTLSKESQIIGLQSWGVVEGRTLVGNRALEGAKVDISSGWVEEIGYGFETKSDENGSFRFEKVPAGRAQVSMSVTQGSTGARTQMAMVDVKVGECSRVQLGGSGVRVTGRVVPTSAQSEINWLGSGNYMRLKNADPALPGHNPPQTYQFFTRPDGSFTVEDVRSGEYRMTFSLNSKQPRIDNIGNVMDQHMGWGQKELVVGSENVDVGEVTVEITLP